MYVGKIAAARDVTIAVKRVQGIADTLDTLAARCDPNRQFLRAAWFAAASHDVAVTLVASNDMGDPLFALPTMPMGPTMIGARSVPGGYWPFRSLPVPDNLDEVDLIAFLSHPASIETLGRAWRIGPIYADDPLTARLKRAAAAAGWTVLVRKLGRTFLYDVCDERGWPRRSTRRRLANYERQLAALGEVTVRHIGGTDWDDSILEDLAKIERESWVGTRTDGRGAKFMSEVRRAEWCGILADPELASALSATILMVGGQPAAFSFDLRAGTTQFSIASSYDERYAAFRPGKIVTAHQIMHARASGVELVDLGVGDSGYKREMGARFGPEVVDLLIVRNRGAASLLALRWGAESEIAREAYIAATRMRDAGRERNGRGRVDALLAAAAIAAAALSFAE